MWIGTQISSYLISTEIWEVGSARLPHLPPIRLPARDALDIERRSRKEVNLRNESRRYTLCCERMQGIVRELALGGATIPEPYVWPAYDAGQGMAPRAVAWLALSEYFRRFYKVDRNGILADTLRYDRLEALFHPPGQTMTNLLALFENISKNPRLPEVFTAASQKAEVVSTSFKVTAEECGAAFESRYSLIRSCVQESLGIVDVVDIV